MRNTVCLWALLLALGGNLLGCGKGGAPSGAAGEASGPKTTETMTPEELKAEQNLVK